MERVFIYEKVNNKYFSFSNAYKLCSASEHSKAEITTVFKYENNFSTADAQGTGSTGAWDMANVGKWVTVKYDNADPKYPINNWSHDTKLLGPGGSADGVLKLGDGARAALYFNSPVTSGNVHVDFGFCFNLPEGETKSNNTYAYFLQTILNAVKY